MKTTLIKRQWRVLAFAAAMVFGSLSLYAGEKTQINVSVTDANHQPIAGVMASLRKVNSEYVLKTAVSEQGELMTLDQIKKGKYIILVSRKDFTNAVVASFEITSVNSQPVEIMVTFGEKSGTQDNLTLNGAMPLDAVIDQKL